MERKYFPKSGLMAELGPEPRSLIPRLLLLPQHLVEYFEGKSVLTHSVRTSKLVGTSGNHLCPQGSSKNSFHPEGFLSSVYGFISFPSFLVSSSISDLQVCFSHHKFIECLLCVRCFGVRDTVVNKSD